MFIFAATGSAVGLGNIWKFPWMVSESGGGAFVSTLYLECYFNCFTNYDWQKFLLEDMESRIQLLVFKYLSNESSSFDVTEIDGRP